MKELNYHEIQLVSGASIKPSHWVFSAGYGVSFGAVCSVVSAFSANPLPLFTSLIAGGAIGAGLHATHDVLKEYGL